MSKKRVNFTIDEELYSIVQPYIKNMSSYIEKCLENFYLKNKEVIEQNDLKTAKYLLSCQDTSNDLENQPNITFITRNQPLQLRLFEIIDNRVIVGDRRKEKVITYPCSDDLSFRSNNSCTYRNKLYYFEIIHEFYDENEINFMYNLQKNNT